MAPCVAALTSVPAAGRTPGGCWQWAHCLPFHFCSKQEPSWGQGSVNALKLCQMLCVYVRVHFFFLGEVPWFLNPDLKESQVTVKEREGPLSWACLSDGEGMSAQCSRKSCEFKEVFFVFVPSHSSSLCLACYAIVGKVPKLNFF